LAKTNSSFFHSRTTGFSFIPSENDGRPNETARWLPGERAVAAAVVAVAAVVVVERSRQVGSLVGFGLNTRRSRGSHSFVVSASEQASDDDCTVDRADCEPSQRPLFLSARGSIFQCASTTISAEKTAKAIHPK